MALVLLTAASTLGGECQEYLDSVEAEQQRHAAAQDARLLQGLLKRRQETLPRRQLLVERLQLQRQRMQAAEDKFSQALPEARARLRPLPRDQSCAFAPQPHAEKNVVLLEAEPAAPLSPLVPSVFSKAQRDLLAPSEQLLVAAKPDATLAEQRQLDDNLASAEDQARAALERLPEWLWVVVVERRQPAELRSHEKGLDYTPGTATGVAYLYQVAGGEFVCLSQFSAQNTPKLPLLLTRYESTREYDYRSRRYRSGYKAIHSPLPLPEATLMLRQDLDQNLWPAVTQTAVRAELAPAPAPPSRRRGK